MTISKILSFLTQVIKNRFEAEVTEIAYDLSFLNKSGHSSSALNIFINENSLSTSEIITLFVSLIPHISPNFFNSIISEHLPNGGDFPEFGGVKAKNHRGMLPTCETVLYILGGTNIEERLAVAEMFSEDHLFAKKGILHVESVPVGEPKMSGRLVLDDEYVELLRR